MRLSPEGRILRGWNQCYDCGIFISAEMYAKNWRYIQNPNSYDPDATDESFCDSCGDFRDKLQWGVDHANQTTTGRPDESFVAETEPAML